MTWAAREYAGAADLDESWLVVVGSGDPAVDEAVRADALAARIWCLDAADPDGGTATLPATSLVTTPDGTVTVAAHAPGDPVLAADVTRTVDGLLAGGAVDLRRRRRSTRRRLGRPRRRRPGRRRTAHRPRPRAARRRPTSWCVDRLAPRAASSNGCPRPCASSTSARRRAGTPWPRTRSTTCSSSEALAGRAVVRLKGGDPYVLGRGGEERLACEAHGIRVEVVPGVTSAVAVPAAAGIPVTHRGVARGFTVVTGHDELPAVPPGTDHTVVLLMGVGRLARSARSLLEAGRPASCPVAVIERGFAPDQRVTFGTLADIAERATDVGVENPAVVVVGDVVRLSPDFPH